MTWRIIGDQPERARAWCREHHPDTFPENPKFTAHINEYCGTIRGVVGWTDYYPGNSIDIHTFAAVSGRWLTRPFIRAVFEYPFLQLGVRRITGRTCIHNEPVNRFVKACGFTLEGVIREAWYSDGSDMLVWGLLKRECRFLGDWSKNETPRSKRELRGEAASQSERLPSLDSAARL